MGRLIENQRLSRGELKALLKNFEDTLAAARDPELGIKPPQWAIDVLEADIAEAKLLLLLHGESINENHD